MCDGRIEKNLIALLINFFICNFWAAPAFAVSDVLPRLTERNTASRTAGETVCPHSLRADWFLRNNRRTVREEKERDALSTLVPRDAADQNSPPLIASQQTVFFAG